eukprot:s683_g19.t2
MGGPKVGSIPSKIWGKSEDQPCAFRLQRASKMTQQRSQWGFVVGWRWPLRLLWLLLSATICAHAEQDAAQGPETSLMSTKGAISSARQWIPFSKMEPDFSVYSSDAFYSARSPFEGTHSVNYIPADSLGCRCSVLLFGLLHGAFGIYHLQMQGFFSHLRFQLLYLLQSLSSLALLGSRLALHRGTAAPLPWPALGRAAAQLLQLQGLGVACGARHQEAMPVALLGGLQWMQLGMSSVATEAKLHWGLFATGLLCGYLAHSSLGAVLDFNTGIAVCWVPGFCYFMNAVAVGLWFLTETLGRPGYHMGVLKITLFTYLLLNFVIDLLWFAGTAHLLLKRQQGHLLQEICMNLSKPMANR